MKIGLFRFALCYLFTDRIVLPAPWLQLSFSLLPWLIWPLLPAPFCLKGHPPCSLITLNRGAGILCSEPPLKSSSHYVGEFHAQNMIGPCLSTSTSKCWRSRQHRTIQKDHRSRIYKVFREITSQAITAWNPWFISNQIVTQTFFIWVLRHFRIKLFIMNYKAYEKCLKLAELALKLSFNKHCNHSFQVPFRMERVLLNWTDQIFKESLDLVIHSFPFRITPSSTEDVILRSSYTFLHKL